MKMIEPQPQLKEQIENWIKLKLSENAGKEKEKEEKA